MTSSKGKLSELSTPQAPKKHEQHQFSTITYSRPTECSQCSSLIWGLMRQCFICVICSLTCHTACLLHVPAVCSGRLSKTKPCQGYVKVPKQGGVKEGWARQFVIVSDYKLFFYDIPDDHNALPSFQATQVLDMRDPQFRVSCVKGSDVIHTKEKDIPCIFKVTTSLWQPSGPCNVFLILADTELERKDWVTKLTLLHFIMKKKNFPDTRVLVARELIDNTLTLLKNTTSAVITGRNRIVLGTEEGMYCIDFTQLEIDRIGESKRIYQLEYIHEEHLLVVVSGKQRQVRLVPIDALDVDDVEWIKVTGSQGCLVLAVGPMLKAPLTFCLCISINNQENSSMIIIYRIARTKTRYYQIRGFGLSVNVQFLQLLSDGRLCVGAPSCFMVYNIQNQDQQLISLLHRENPLYETIAFSSVEALRVIELSRDEYLLVFGNLAAYVDRNGRESRDKEILFPAIPTAIAYRDGQLVVYSDTHINIFNCATGEWVQTFNIKKAKPLNDDGSLSICFLNDLPHLFCLSNSYRRTEGNISVVGRSLSPRGKNRSRKGPVISAPTNFQHVSHYGYFDGDFLLGRFGQFDIPSRFDG